MIVLFVVVVSESVVDLVIMFWDQDNLVETEICSWIDAIVVSKIEVEVFINFFIAQIVYPVHSKKVDGFVVDIKGFEGVKVDKIIDKNFHKVLYSKIH